MFRHLISKYVHEKFSLLPTMLRSGFVSATRAPYVAKQECTTSIKAPHVLHIVRNVLVSKLIVRWYGIYLILHCLAKAECVFFS